MYRYVDFKDLITWAKQELHLHGVIITWKFYDALTLPDGSFADVKTDPKNKTALIRVAASDHHPRAHVADSILHELRHVWQEVNYILVETWVSGEIRDQPIIRYNRNGDMRMSWMGNGHFYYEWKGTSFAEPATWKRKKYIERPNEIDAREWAKWAMNQYYGTKFPVTYVKQLVGSTKGMKLYKIKGKP